ncbi:hypothetical protein NLJ89_g6862 [Agrocybe chaxingu]|uniref:F-box domain-containing protein n=1 Tax=Agrocybe chaxingu TaxID=84603 RepID=A0A9W8MTP2_9AGAR|nr:hypothetical protein NLJ89_g6862 [Agrocybe chaxingu]
MSNPVVSLPQETLESIIDFLHDDRPTLLTCSLASPRLMPACRHHLFSEVLVHPTRLTSLLKLLGAPRCSFSRSVSRLIVSGTGVRHVEPQSTSTRPPPRLASSQFGNPISPIYSPHPVLHFLASLNSSSTIDLDVCTPVELERVRERLQRVISVRFSGMSTNDVPEAFWRATDGLIGISTVEVDRVTLHSPSHFLEHLSSLPSLRSLSISSISASHASAGNPPTTGYSVPKVQGRLDLPLLDLRRTHNLSLFFQNQGTSRDGRASVAFLEWLLAQHIVPTAHTFKFNVDCEPEMLAPLMRYMDAVGAGVREAWLAIPSSAPDRGATPRRTAYYAPEQPTTTRGVLPEALCRAFFLTQSSFFAFLISLFRIKALIPRTPSPIPPTHINFTHRRHQTRPTLVLRHTGLRAPAAFYVVWPAFDHPGGVLLSYIIFNLILNLFLVESISGTNIIVSRPSQRPAGRAEVEGTQHRTLAEEPVGRVCS